MRLALAAALVVLVLGDASAMAMQRPESALMAAARAYVPAPPRFSVVYDNPQDAGGLDPATGRPYPAVGQYADTNTNTVHTTRGYGRRQIAQDVGQLLGYNVLSAGDRSAFSRLLGTDPARWSSGRGAQPGALGGGDEAFANYYSVYATGGLKRGESVAIGDTTIDPRTLRLYGAMLGRLGHRRRLPGLDLKRVLASAR